MVVFPAPFGPIRAKISPSSMAKSTSDTARRPPKYFVTSCTSSSGMSDRPVLLHFEHRRLSDLAAPQLGRPAPARDDAPRPQDHDHHQGQPEQQEARVAHGPEPLAEEHQEGRAHDRPGDAS